MDDKFSIPCCLRIPPTQRLLATDYLTEELCQVQMVLAIESVIMVIKFLAVSHPL
jgi:hypothetical protein